MIVLPLSVYSGKVPFKATLKGVRDRITVHFDLKGYVAPAPPAKLVSSVADPVNGADVVKLQVSDNGKTWTDLGSFALSEMASFQRVDGTCTAKAFRDVQIRGSIFLSAPLKTTLWVD